MARREMTIAVATMFCFPKPASVWHHSRQMLSKFTPPPDEGTMLLLSMSLTVLAAALLVASPAHADGVNDPRQDLEDAYYEEYGQHGSLYQSAPVTHVVPSFKTVTLALAADRYNVTVANHGSLKLSGYRAAPYVAVSLKRIGLGFSAETGEKHLLYTDSSVLYPRVQHSDADYKAIGVYAYWLPFETRGEQSFTASTVIGAKDYNVTHKVTPLNDPGSPDQGREKFRYNLDEFMVGALVEFRLLKLFSLVPWTVYTYLDTRDPLAQAADVKTNYYGVGDILKGDTKVLWQSNPKLDFGLDLLLKVRGFALHLGEAFGILVANQSNDQIIDKTMSLSVSLDLKGD